MSVSPIQRTARIAGLLSIGIAVLAIFANFFVINGLIVAGDATKTASNITANDLLFRAGIAAFVVTLILDILVAWLLYVILKPVNQDLSFLAAWFRIIYAGIFAVALSNFFTVLQLLSGSSYLSVFDTDQLHSQAMVSLSSFTYTWQVGLAVFALHLFIVGYLVVKSSIVPRIIGALLMIASLGYLIDSFAHFLLHNYVDYQTVFTTVSAVPSIIGELSFAVWLVVKGVKIQPGIATLR